MNLPTSKTFITLAVIVTAAAWFWLQNGVESQVASKSPKAQATQENESSSTVRLQAKLEVESNRKIILTGESNSGQELDYGSLKDVLDFYKQESQDLLDAYLRYELDMDSLESRSKRFRWRLICSFPIFYDTQDDLDRDLATRDQQFVLSSDHERYMKIVGRCDALRNHLGNEEILNQDSLTLLGDALEQPNKDGQIHPVWNLGLSTNSMNAVSFEEAAKRLVKAYSYAADYPEYRIRIVGEVSNYLRHANTQNDDDILKKKYAEAFEILSWRYYPTSLTDSSFMPTEAAKQRRLKDFQQRNHPQEFDEIIELADDIEESMDRGDWSWLNLDRKN